MFRAIETIRKSTRGKLSDGKSAGGKSRLSIACSTKLSEYYRNAIRQNSDKNTCMSDENVVAAKVEVMRRAIMAIIHHEVKCPDVTRHKYCPDNTDSVASWCE
jgi:hypothetical protein